MSSRPDPTSANFAARALKKIARTQNAALGSMAAIFLCLALVSCAGYGNGTTADLALPEQYRSLYIKSVDNPTMNPGLDNQLRTQVRDELTRRGRITWSTPEAATAYMKIKILDFTSSTSVSDRDDETLISNAVIRLEAWIMDKRTGDQIWHSGRLSASESFRSGGKELAEAKVLNLAVRRLADSMARVF